MPKRIAIRLHRETRGQTLVEFALVLPVLVMILFAIVQFGITIHEKMVLQDAARVGARAGAASRGDLGLGIPDATQQSKYCTDAAVATAADLDKAKLGVSCTSGWGPGEAITVTLTYPCDATIPIVGVDICGGSNLTAVAVDRNES